MTYDITSGWNAAIEANLRDAYPCIKEVAVVQNGDTSLPQPGMAWYIGRMKSLGLEELAVESGEDRALIVKQGYESSYVIVSYADGVSAADLSRHIRLLLSVRAEATQAIGKRYVSKVIVDKNLKRWERAVTLIFGKLFASKLMPRALHNRDRGAMTYDDLCDVRAFLSSATGECLIFELEKVDK